MKASRQEQNGCSRKWSSSGRLIFDGEDAKDDGTEIKFEANTVISQTESQETPIKK